MIYDIIEGRLPSLPAPTPSFDFRSPPTDPIQLAKDLYETMLNAKGLGLSAPQIGMPYSVLAMYATPGLVCYNPRIVDTTSEEILMEESCLSHPNLFLKIKRPRMIKVRYTEPNGNVITTKMDGVTARVFQHQLDYLHGVHYIARANQAHLSRALRQQKQLNRTVRRAEERGIV
jgi:peptide deformylase